MGERETEILRAPLCGPKGYSERQADVIGDFGSGRGEALVNGRKS